MFRDRGSPAEYGAGTKPAIGRGWLVMHDSGTFATFTPAGAELFAWSALAWRWWRLEEMEEARPP